MSTIDLNAIEKSVIVRQLTLEDFERVIEMQLTCFPGMDPWQRDQYESQLRTFPQGQIGVEYEGELVASSSSLILDYDIYGEAHHWEEVSENGYITNHTPEGDTLYGIEIMVHPEYRGLKLARRIYEARKQLAREHNLMRIVIGGRIPGYEKHAKEMNVREYVDAVVRKALVDPVLTSQLANGFVLKRILTDYLEEDSSSQGYAILLEWPNVDYRPDSHKRYLSSRPVRICAVQYQMRTIRDFDDFATQCEYFVDVASDYKADFVLFPELLTTQLLSFLEPMRPGAAARKLSEFTPQYLELFSNLAIHYNVNIVGGSHFTEEDGHLYNIAYLFKRNGEIGKQYKIHVTPSERTWWGIEPGDSVEVFETDRGRISIQICYDVEFPELSRIATQNGAQIIFTPFCTDERSGYWRVRHCAQARCIENHVYVAIAGTVGNLPRVENMDIQYAQSAILTPSDFEFARDGIAAECTPNVETVVISDVDLEMLKRHRKKGTTRNWMDRRLDLYDVRYLKDHDEV